jgi:hypothetical protein
MNRMANNLQLGALAACLFATTIASAATAYDPTVAYVQLSGNSANLYVANADGSHAIRLASGYKAISGIDFAPGGGRIAFADRQGLKVVTYTASNSGITVNSTVQLSSGIFGSPDFSSDGTRILYYQVTAPVGFRAIPASGGASVFLHAGSGLGVGRWLRPADLGNAFAFLKAVPHGPNVPVDYEIWTVLLDANDQVISAGPVLSTATQAFKSIEHFDTAHTRNALLIAADYPTVIDMVDFDLETGVVTDTNVHGFQMHYSADDSHIVFKNLNYLGSADYVNSLDLGTGVVTHLTKKGSFGVTDARP